MDNLIEKIGRVTMYLLALCLAVLAITLIMRPVSDIFGRVMGIISLILAVPTVWRWYIIKRKED